MPSMADGQAAFADALRDPELPAPWFVVRPDGIETKSPQTKRFDVYRNNVFTAGIDALAETFPAVERLVGEEFFRAVARAFLDTSPPASPILTLIGSTFGEFLDDFPPAARIPYLGDVARVEYARIKAYHAADAEPLPIARLAETSPELIGQSVLVPHPSVTLIRSEFPAASLWAASTDALDPEAVDMNQPEDVLIVRPKLDVETLALPAGGGAFLAALLDGQTIQRSAELAASEDSAFDLSSHLAGTFSAGAYVAVTAEPDPNI